MREFSLEGFAVHLADLVGHHDEAVHHALSEAGHIIEEEAKAEIGHYQPEAAPFAKWQDLADSTKDDRVKAGFPADEPLLRTGALRDSIEHKVVGPVVHIGSDSPIAEYQEVGTQRIPPRSFLGGALVRKTDEVLKVIGEDMVAYLSGEGARVGLSASHPGPGHGAEGEGQE